MPQNNKSKVLSLVSQVKVGGLALPATKSQQKVTITHNQNK